MKWIVHAKDHFSKFTWAAALERKGCHEVTEFVKNIFYDFRPPKILQCDNNGGEFTGKELSEMLKTRFPVVKIIHSDQNQ